MKLGFVSAILADCTFEETIDIAHSLNYQAVELACWPSGKAERRYAGVCHLNTDQLSDSRISHVKEYCRRKNVAISALAFYPNVMDGNLSKRESSLAHLKKVISASAKLGVHMVTTFIGRDQTKTIEENIELFKEIWPPIIQYAEALDVKIAIENCPMLFCADEWPGGQNLMTTPDIWRKLFALIPSSHFGLNYDPSHFVWQMMDYIKPIYEFRDKIFQVHCKDLRLHRDRLDQVGIMAYPLQYMSPKLPGLGDINWANYISALTDIQYKGCVCIEIEDKAFEGSPEEILNALRISKNHIEQLPAWAG